MTFVPKPRSAPILVAVILLTTAGAIAPAGAESMLLIEADSGKVLHSENSTSPWYPASVTKLMTTYVTLRAVKEGRLKLDTLLTVSANAAAQAPSKMGFKSGTQVTVDNALKMLMVKSANDIAVVLAEGISGSIENFANDMNKAAQRLGMVQSSYVNPNGLPADGQITSARDLAILARALIREFPEYDLYWHISAIKFGKRVMRNYNTLIDRYPGADGMKTGFICASGFNLVASATRNGRRLIAVVLGAPSSPLRAVKAAQMLERGFNAGTPSWLTPSLGTVDQLKPVPGATPINLREEMCGKHRKRPAAESEDSEEPEETTNAQFDSGSPYAIKLSGLANAKPSALIGPLTPSMEPIVVYVGSKPGPDSKVASAPARSAKSNKPKKPAPKGGAVANAAPAAVSAPQPNPVHAPAFAPTAPAYPSTSAFTPAIKPANGKPKAAAPKPAAQTTTTSPQTDAKGVGQPTAKAVAQ